MSMDKPGVRASQYGRFVSSVYELLYPAPEADLVRDRFESITPPGGVVVDAGAGTGRVAIPLAYAGFSVTAIDASVDMLLRLKERDPDNLVAAQVEDFTDSAVTYRCNTVAVLNSTLFMLLTQSEQVSFLRNVRSWLDVGGHLVLETYNPHIFVPTARQAQQFTILSDGVSVLMDSIETDRQRQKVVMVRHFRGRGRSFSFVEESRYAFDDELFLMASLAGFELVERWADWSGSSVADGGVAVTD